MHPYLLHNAEIRDTTTPLIAPGQVGFLNGWGVFSTLRVSNGILFAFDRHYRRMQRDAARLRVPFEISPDDLEKDLLRLVETNHAYDATLRVAVVRNRGNIFESPRIKREVEVIAFTTDLVRWGKGVKLSYVPHGRYGASPFAGIKSTSWSGNLALYEEAHERGFDEVILLNEDGQISECTSANIFIIQGDHVWTPPVGSSGCLPGITRAILLEEIHIPGFSIGERELTPSDLDESDGVFITSTTRDLLPVLEIDHNQLPQADKIIAELAQAFRHCRRDYNRLSELHKRKEKVFAG